MTSPSEPPAPGSSKDPQIESFAAELRAAKGQLPQLMQPLSASRRHEIIQRTLDSRTKPNVIHAASRFTARRWAMAGSALALAASLVLFVALRSPQGHGPRYSLDVSGDAEVRGSDVRPDGPVRLRPSTRFVVRIRPESPGPAAALRALVVREGKARTLDVAYRVESGGVFVVDAPARQALGDQVNGPATLVFVVGPQLPGDDELLTLAADAQAKASDSFALLRRDVVFDGWGTARREIDVREIEWMGCHGLTRGPVCEFATDTELRLWIPIENANVRLVGETQSSDVVKKNIREGTQFRVRPHPSSTQLDVLGADDAPIFRLPLRAVQEDPALRAAFGALQKNACDEVSKHLEVAERNPVNVLAAARMRARQARRCGNGTEAKRLLEDVVTKDRAAGRLSDEADDRHLLAFMLVTRDFDFEAARNLLWSDASYEQCPECRMDVAYYRSVWALETGRYEEALRQLDFVLTSASRLDLPDRLHAARNQRMDLLATLGRMDEAAELARASLADAAGMTDPCVQVKLRTSAAWALLRGVETGTKDADDVRRSAASAVNDARASCSASLVNALVNAAYAETYLGELTKAQAFLADAHKRVEPTDNRMTSWLDALEVEIALLDDPRKALGILDKLSKKGAESSSPELVFRSASGRARASRKIGNVDETRIAFAQANEALETWSRLVPLGEGRESFFDQQRTWARETVDFEVGLAERLADGTPEKEKAIRTAAGEVERSMERFFKTLTATEAGPLGDQTEYRRARQHGPATAFTAPNNPAPHAETIAAPSNVLRLVYHPIQRGWVGFALEPTGTSTMARLATIPLLATGSTMEKPTAALAAALLDPFAASISRASEVETPAWGPLRRVPWEALPWKKNVLADAVQVRHRLSLPPPEASTCSGRARALVVLDPSATLAGAEKSALAVRQGLARMHFDIVELSGAAAERKAVLNELTNPCTQLFHYDGHAAFRGRDGVHAALELSGDALTVTDVLALPRVPEAVTLLGCETAKDDGMGMAQAFLSRGARQVLAAMDTVDDELSGLIATRLYAQTNGDTLDLARALRTATHVVRQIGDRTFDVATSSSKAWWLFRVMAR